MAPNNGAFLLPARNETRYILLSAICWASTGWESWVERLGGFLRRSYFLRSRPSDSLSFLFNPRYSTAEVIGVRTSSNGVSGCAPSAADRYFVSIWCVAHSEDWPCDAGPIDSVTAGSLDAYGISDEIMSKYKDMLELWEKLRCGFIKANWDCCQFRGYRLD